MLIRRLTKGYGENMNESFALREHCFLVSGAKRGAIYDLKTGDIFSINGDALKLLKLCESSFSIQEIVEKLNFSENKSELFLYLNSLKENNIGIFLNEHEQIKKDRYWSLRSWVQKNSIYWR